MRQIWLKSSILSVVMCMTGALVAQGPWYVYHTKFEAKSMPGEENSSQDIVDAFLERGMISPQMEPRARAQARERDEAWKRGFWVHGESFVMSTGSELSFSSLSAESSRRGGPQEPLKGFKWSEGVVEKRGSRYQVHRLGPNYPTSSALSWLFLGGRLHRGFVEVSRDTTNRVITFEMPADDRGFPGATERVQVTYADPEMTRWISGREWLLLPDGRKIPSRSWEVNGHFGKPGYSAKADLHMPELGGEVWRTYEFEFLRTESTGFTPASIPLGASILDHRVPYGHASLEYEWDGEFADVRSRAGGFPVAGWYLLWALGFAALGVYFWRKR